MGKFSNPNRLDRKVNKFLNFRWSWDRVRPRKAANVENIGSLMQILMIPMAEIWISFVGDWEISPMNARREIRGEKIEKFPCGEVKWKVVNNYAKLPSEKPETHRRNMVSIGLDRLEKAIAREKNLISSTLNDVRKENSQIVTVRPSFCCAMFIFQTIVKKKRNWGRRIEVG